MSAAELRKAAETLRELGTNVTAHSGGKDLWFDADIDLRNAIRGTFIGNEKSAPDDARWIALMSPGVGLALADLLDETAETWHLMGSPESDADDAGEFIRLARLINGGA